MSKCNPNFLALTAVSLLICVVIVLGDPIENPKDAKGSSLLDFGSFVERFHKSYDLTNSMTRAKLFLARTLNIFKHNVMFKDRQKTYYLRQNQYIDLTKDELMNNYVNRDLIDVDVSKNRQEENSQSSLSGIEEEDTKNKEGPILDFTNDQTSDDFGGFVEELREKPDVAENFERIVNIGDSSDLKAPIDDDSADKEEISYASLSDMMDEDSIQKKDDASNIGQKEAVKPKKQTGIKYRIDWRVTKCISAPKSQLDCNSCYAFATLDLLEFFYCRQKKEQARFSQQYVVDCGKKTGLNGCQGGKLSNVGKFIMDYGIELEDALPYTAREGVCLHNEEENKSSLLRPKVHFWKTLMNYQIWDESLRKSPLVVGINMPSDFLAYGGGLHDGEYCVPEMTHAMLLVGNGLEDGVPFWLFKNTLSENWGEQGYFRLSKKAPQRCFNAAVVARVEF